MGERKSFNGKHRISADALVSSILRAVSDRKKLGKNTLVRIIPENGKDFSYEHHPLEDYLRGKQIPFYLDPDQEGSEKDYGIDLREIEVVYPNQEARERS